MGETIGLVPHQKYGCLGDGNSIWFERSPWSAFYGTENISEPREKISTAMVVDHCVSYLADAALESDHALFVADLSNNGDCCDLVCKFNFGLVQKGFQSADLDKNVFKTGSFFAFCRNLNLGSGIYKCL